MTDYKKMAELNKVRSVGTVCDQHTPEEDARTRQSELDASNINLTIKRYNLQPEEFDRLQEGWSGKVVLGEFGDVSELPTFAEMLATVNRARDVFMMMPPEVRAFFENNPAVMLDAWERGEHREVFEGLGFLVKLPDVKAKAKAEREARVAEIAEGVRAGTVDPHQGKP